MARITDDFTNPVGGTRPLNDTGINLCADASQNNLACPVSGFPGQDAEYGRDVTHNDINDGHAGFSFTKISNSGNALPAEAALGSGPNDWACTRDNVTGLIWEVKTDDGLRAKRLRYSWHDPDATTNGGYAGGGVLCDSDTHTFVQALNNQDQGLCGASDWRLPNRFELASLTRDDKAPAMDSAFFHTEIAPSSGPVVWSSSPYAGDANYAWNVNFSNGLIFSNKLKNDCLYVWLVRGGQ